ncbi:MAG: M48 family metalloprotease [Gaiellaceae bacterium]
MSEMTATRIGAGATLLTLWLAAAWLLWRTSVPAGLHAPHVAAGDLFAAGELARLRHHDAVLRWLWLAETLAGLGAVGLVARRPPRRLQVAVELVALWLARLPFDLAAHGWQRGAGIARSGYLEWLLARLPLELAVLVAICGLAWLLARRVPRAAAPALAVLATATVLLQPLAGSGHRIAPNLYVEKVSDRTRLANAEAIGAGPTRRIVLWDTLLRFPRDEVRFVIAHERTHLARHHILKGLAWFLLLALPLLWPLSRLTAPRALLAALCLQLALLLLANTISRRYEREADWQALQRTHDPAAAERLFVRFARTSLDDPDPPLAWKLLLADHATTVERVALANARNKAATGANR